MGIGLKERISLICDEGSFVEFDKGLATSDALNNVDKKSYKKRIEEYEKKFGRQGSSVSGECTINGISAQIVLFEFNVMGGSLASVEGEKITRAIHRAIANKQGLIIVSASGGARMQESTYSLMQMAKTSAALNALSNAKLPFISILSDPTMGGVSASFAFLGDIIMAEPGAMIGFAGARVIKQTIGADLPQGFQTAEFLLEHGLIDMIVQRKEMKEKIAQILEYFKAESIKG